MTWMHLVIRFHLDEHIPQSIARGLELRGIDVMTALRAGLLGAMDEDHLAFATHEGRVLVTRDRDFIRLHVEGRSHAGIVIVSNPFQIGRIVRHLALMQQVLDSSELRGRLEYL